MADVRPAHPRRGHPAQPAARVGQRPGRVLPRAPAGRLPQPHRRGGARAAGRPARAPAPPRPAPLRPPPPPPLPRPIATDYAGTVLLGALALSLVAGGLSHRSEV